MIVKSTLPEGKVCLWERHEAHPGGEVFIADNKPHEVGDTSAVRVRIKRGDLVETGDKPQAPRGTQSAPQDFKSTPAPMETPLPESEPKPAKRR